MVRAGPKFRWGRGILAEYGFFAAASGSILSRVPGKKRTRSEPRVLRAAQWLCDAHARRERFAPLPDDLAPRSVDEAYAIQDELVALRAQQLGAIGGYKIALSTPQMRKFLGVDEPQAGVMLESTLRRTPARVRAADYVNLIIEFEIAVRMADGLPAADAPFSRSRVAQAVGAVMPAIELAADPGAGYNEVRGRPPA